MENKKPFKILSIDGGGIRGVFPAKYLLELEATLAQEFPDRPHIYQHFNLITGTSTGGIIALALALGIPAARIHKLYMENASAIFGAGKRWIGWISQAKHKRAVLEGLLREVFQTGFNGADPRLADVKTNVCIPIYDLMEGRPAILKNKYNAIFVRDYHLPAYMVALATSAAPTFFDPYTAAYEDLNGNTQSFNHKIDGGVFVNNPALMAIVEAQKAFGCSLADLKVLSIGTGHHKFADGCARKRWGLAYWLNKTRIMDLFMQGQSQQVENLISLLHLGIGKQEGENFSYMRITTELDKTCLVELDETDAVKLEKLSEKALQVFEYNNHHVMNKIIR
ncbi:CBASS cGAMP-activated phospholipase [Chitinophaga sp. S165]|uniref:CBASS cGAMP-activated phospholipase n=1 Tax=Chitinophaga sp. S165 TaxID=2135462 RepID=UPI000D7110C7|nr:CBASS cGAMP-activated phospholipase [Chitinophaga sp. S165]PWV46220.1 patatin-like phospholipase [Chitinophaga sp. S165]